MTEQHEALLPGVRVEDPHTAVDVRGGDRCPVGAPGGGGRPVNTEIEHLVTRSDVHHDGRVALQGHDDPGTGRVARVEREAPRAGTVQALDAASGLPGGEIQDEDEALVPPRRGEQRAIGTERGRHGVAPRRARQRVPLRPGRHVPDLGVAILARGAEQGAVGAEGDAGDRFVVGGDRQDRLAGGGVVDDDGAIRVRGGEPGAVRGPLDGTAHLGHVQDRPRGGDRVVQHLLRLGHHGTVPGSGPVDRGQSEQDAAFGVDVEVGVGGGDELPGGGDAPLFGGDAPLLGGPVPLADGHDAHDHGDDESDTEGRELGPEPPVRSGGAVELVGLAFPLPVAFGPAGAEEGSLEGVEVGGRPVAPFDRLVQPDAAVELAVGPAHGVPRLGGGAEVPPGPLPFDVVVQPAAQPGPGAGECLVGQLHHALVAGHQPRGDELFDDLFALRVGGHEPAGDPGAHRLALGRGRHQAQQEVTEDGALLGRGALVELFGGLGDGAADAARGPVAGDREGAALAALPGLAQGVREQRKRTRFTFHVPHQQVDQTGFEAQPRLTGGSLDRGPQVVLSHALEQEQAPLDDPCHPGVRGQLAQPVGPQRHHQRRPFRVLGQRREEPGALVGVRAQGHGLLALVDHQHRSSG